MSEPVGRLGQAGTIVCEKGLQCLALARTEPNAGRRAQLECIGETLLEESEEIEDVDGDILVACQVMRLGRGRAPEKHLRRHLADLAHVRAQRHAAQRHYYAGVAS
jgi:hypothetical protein